MAFLAWKVTLCIDTTVAGPVVWVSETLRKAGNVRNLVSSALPARFRVSLTVPDPPPLRTSVADPIVTVLVAVFVFLLAATAIGFPCLVVSLEVSE